MKTNNFIFHYIYKYKWKYLFGIIALFIVDLFNLYIPQFTGDITDGLLNHTLGMNGLFRGILLILTIGAIIALGRFAWRYFLFGACRIIEYELRNDLFKHLETLSMRYFNKHKTGDLMSHFTNDLNAVRMTVGPGIITTFDATIMTAMVLIKMVTHVDGRLTVLVIIPLLFVGIGGIYYGKAEEKRFSAKQEAFSQMTDQVQESISGIRVIKAFVQERMELKSFAKTNQNNMYHNLRVVKLQAIMIPLLDVVIGLSSLVALLYGGYLTLIGEITLGRFIAFIQYIGMLVWPMIAAGETITIISQGIASIKRIAAIFKEEPDIKDTVADHTITKLHGEITIENLTFKYPDSEQSVLKEVSVQINPGETLAIIGKTGSGKTTIANLLLRLYDVEDNHIRLDGKDIKHIPLKTLREDIAYVPQDNFLFSDTIKNNIAFGSESNDLEPVIEAAKLACIHENIIDFPNGYETVVGERGTTLSGGQKQRSSIARAFMKESPILILDDALSAVDTDTEERILQNLRQNRNDKTTIIIAHRISTIQSADHILVLDDGSPAEYGTHEDLLSLGGIYKKMYDKQQLESQLIEE